MGEKKIELTKIATELEIRSSFDDFRDAIKNGPKAPNIWGFFSNKNNALLTLIGDVTFIQAVLFEGDPTVSGYSILPDSQSTDEVFAYGNDIIVDHEDGSRHWYFCTRTDKRSKQSVETSKPTLDAKRRLAANLKAEFHVRTEQDFSPRMTEFRNWLTLSAAITRARDFSSEKELTSLFEHLEAVGKSSIRDVMKVQGIDPGLMLAAIARALQSHQISSELVKTPLSLNTVLSIAKIARRNKVENLTKSPPISSDDDSDLIPQNRRTAGIPMPWRNLKKWPEVDPDRTRSPETYRQNKKAVELYLAGRPLVEIQQQTGLGEEWVRKLYKKCMKTHPDGRIYGFRGCVRYGCGERSYNRKAPLPSDNMHEASTSGYSGALLQLFDRYPDQLLATIESYVLKIRRGLQERLPEVKISWKRLHGQFLSELEKLGVKKTEYPFTTRDQGYAAIAAIGRSILYKKPVAFIRSRMGTDAARRVQIGRGEASLIQATGPYQILQLDFHKHDSAAIVELTNPRGGTILAPVPRWWIGCVVDEFNGTILGSSDSFEKQTTQSCVMDLVDSAIAPEEPNEELKSYRVCEDGVWLPNQQFPSHAYHGWDVLKLDRAWAHYSKNFVTSLVSTVGCAVCFSRPKAWWARSIVERTFLEFTKRGSQRLSTTYGSGPSDPTRNDPEGSAIKFRVKRDDICLFARAVIREINERKGEGNFWESALSSIRRCELMPTYLPRHLPRPRMADRPTLWITEEVRVEANVKNGVAPSVRRNRCRFTGSELSNQWGLVGQFVYLQIGRRDIRLARVVNAQSGEYLGPVHPERRWSLHKVSWQNFIMIQKYGRIESAHHRSDDPVEDFNQMRADEVANNTGKGRNGTKTAAAQAENVIKEKSSPSGPETSEQSKSDANDMLEEEPLTEGTAPSGFSIVSMLGLVSIPTSYSKG